MTTDYRQAYAAAMLDALGTEDAEPYFRDAAPCYTDGAASGKSWCGIVALSVARSVGLTDWEWRDGRGFLYRLGWDQMTRKPAVGDICYLDRPHQHHCVVISVNHAEGTVLTVGGNEGVPGAVRGPTERKIRDKRLSFFSIRKWVDAAEKRDAEIRALEKADTDHGDPPDTIPNSKPPDWGADF
jgi:hypothetical protein